MGNVKFNAVTDSDIQRSIHELTAEVSKVKTEMFRTVVMGKGGDLDRSILKRFETYVNDFLRYWSEYANGLKSAIRAARINDCEKDITVIEYGYIKRFIYSSYDYASILQFVDGMLKGVKSGDMENPADIDDFKNHTIDMAFAHQDPNVAGLLDSVLSDQVRMVQGKANILDVKTFDTVRNYNELFPFRDRPELYRAITKTLEYITTNNITLNGGNVRLLIAMVNNIGEYITYSLAAYASRIFIISKYAEPFINCSHLGDNAVTESTDPRIPLMYTSEDPNGATCTVLHNTDELIVKDHQRLNELAKRLHEFLKLIGTESMFKDLNLSQNDFHVDKKFMKDNKLIDKLKDNVLWDFFINHTYARYHNNRETDISETKYKVHDIMYNNLNGILGTNSSKADFLLIIQNAEYGTSLRDYQNLAKDLAAITVDLGARISRILDTNSWEMKDAMHDNTFKPGPRKMIMETMRMLQELYEEVMFALFQKALYIERKINQLRASDIKKTIDITTLNVPDLKSDLDDTNAMMLSVPHTTREAFTENVDLYALPVFEGYELYDEYLRSQPAFSNDWYLKEVAEEPVDQSTTMKDKFVDKAGDAISTIINKLRAIIKALWERVQSFYNSQSFGMAKNWVLKNEEVLRSMQFPADAKLEILPYKDNITLPQGFSNLQKNLSAFNEKSVESADSVQKYLRNLYPNDQVAQWFADDPEGKVAAQKYMNLILFDEGSDQPKKPVVITGAEIAKKVDMWINTIKASDATLKEFKKINDDINNAVGSINSKIVNISNQNKAVQQSTGNAKSTDASKAGNTDDLNKQQAGVDKTALLSDASARITSAINRLWSPVSPIIIRATMNQYGYIKTAYSLGQSSHQSHTPETDGQPQKGQL